MAKNYMATDQYNNTWHNLGPTPRKAMMAYFGTKHAEKMYRTDGNNVSHHIGYVIADHWLTFYEVREFKGRGHKR